jgi:hypothetical protein
MSSADLRRRTSSAFIRALLVLLAALETTSATPVRAQSLYDPALHFRTITTEHFVLYFHQGEETYARRLATIAEETWRTLKGLLGPSPPARTHVVLVDQTELANGSATPVPFDTIVVTATWPPGSDFLGRTDDWLRLVFTHEFTHIVHLDRSEAWARLVRGVFGRVPLAFPNLFLPIWQIEGLAVYEESAITGEGRLHSGDFLAIEEEARRANAVEQLDRVNGGLTDWPGGFAPYAYGSGFHQYLADRYGTDTLAALADATAGRLPYTSSRAFAQVYGKSLGDLWREYQSQPATRASPAVLASPGSLTGAERVDDRARQLTHHGFTISGPRIAPPQCATCGEEIVYSLVTPDGFPTLNAIGMDGTGDRTLATRYLGSTSGVSQHVVVFDQQELRRNIGLYGDLFAFDRDSGHVRALTSEARLLDPDLSPDGTTIACVHDHDGQRDLVVLHVKPGTSAAGDVTTVAAGVNTQFDTPRWSPDGKSIAVTRHVLGGQSELVVVDPGAGSLRVVWSDPAARVVTPAWRPDGQAIVAAADFSGDVFNLYEFDARAQRAPVQITHTTGGATWPDVTPDGRAIVFVGYTVAGFDLFTMPYPGGPDRSYELAQTAPDPQIVRASAAPSLVPSRPYSPWPTLKPTSWAPFVDDSADQLRAGAAVTGFDVLGYHGYALSASWLVSGPRNATTASAASPDWQAAYVYARWRPQLFLSASRSTSYFAGPPTDTGLPTNSTLREYQFQAGVQVPFQHVRISHRAFASIVRLADDYTLADGPLAVSRTALRAAWATATAHLYGYSISPEGGVAIGATAETVRQALGSIGDANTFTVDARAYLPGVGQHHVLALRVAAGASSGNELAGRTFLLGGAAAATDVLNFSSSAVSLLRGFPLDTFAGTHAAVVNADYRLPLARPERGHGTLPVFVRALYAAVFADAGNAWTETFRASDVKTSAGMELSTDILLGYSLPVTASAGVGWGHDGTGQIANSRTFYLRLGRAF